MRLLVKDEIPCWYELSWDEQGLVLLIRIHREVIEEIGSIPENTSIVTGLRNEFGFSSFEGSLQQDFGFNGALKRKNERDGFVEFAVPIPEIHKETGLLCKHCEGSRKDKYSNAFDCFYCDGARKERIHDWKLAFGVSASLTLLFNVLEHQEKTTSAQIPQLLTVRTMTKEGMHGSSLFGAYGISFCNWLKSLGEGTEINEAILAMQTAWKHMMMLPEFQETQFMAYLQKDGFLTVDCPGDACGIHPSHTGWGEFNEGEGYEFSCHNVDNPAQQIVLLVGLAALHDMARKEIAA